ncbi:MAG: exosortase C-terminal domain/associated protein EpsI [Pyrinomonadaceae bacterium]
MISEGSAAGAARSSFWLLMLVLIASGVAINWWQLQGETPVVRQSLEGFPSQIGSWRQVGPNERFPKETERVLRADDYLSRLYQSTEGRVTSFYVGYYASQRTGATYHSPLNCLPGSGWSMTDPARITIQPTNGAAPFEANRYVVKKGRNRQVLIYWYQGARARGCERVLGKNLHYS